MCVDDGYGVADVMGDDGRRWQGDYAFYYPIKSDFRVVSRLTRCVCMRW